MNILFSCAGRRKYLIDYFKAEPLFNGRLIGTDMSRTAPALAACDAWYEVPSIYDESYLDTVLDICKKEAVTALISLNDMELPILAANEKRFSDIGVRLVLAESAAIELCSDKWATVQFGLEHNIPVPASYLTVDSALTAIANHEVSYPLIVKPRWGSASFGLYVINADHELAEAFSTCKSEFLASHLAKFAGSDDLVLIQEFIVGDEYGVDIFNDMQGKYHGVVCKKKLSMRSGETDKAVTVNDAPFSYYAQQIATNLKHKGNLDCDFLERDNKMYLLELNPRFGGGYPFTHEAGGNFVKALLLSLLGRDNEIAINYRVGETFAKCDTLVAAR
ncbi:ATP-grasp domain-containing protein [Oceanisphaera profunda]|uniref:ATP-grasp domain-containing protein n=1 Tax=Oceanisphaera profunda TaxID=1416627 RepID=UPI001374794C|nr:ATP-grasp domain-containing protein [Oceanisphaera profunda]